MTFVISACSGVATPTAVPTTIPAATPITIPTTVATTVLNTVLTNLPFPTGKFMKSGTTDYGMMFKKDGTFQVFEGSNTFIHATYSVDGNTFTEKTSEHGCPDVPRSFQYTFDGTNLTFNYIGDPAKDPCTARRGDFNNVTYTLSFPTGKFINSEHPDHGLIFNTNGTSAAFEISSPGSETTLAEGTYTVKGDIVTDTPNDTSCPPMSFKYSFDGTNLAFSYIDNPADDPCGPHRRPAFDNVTYTLSAEANFPTGKFLIKSGTTEDGMMFNPDGTFSIFEGSNTFIHNTYTVTGDTFTEKTSEAGCPDVPRSFKYTFDGANLTFNYIGDPAADTCEARRAEFNNVTYSLSQ